MTNTDQLFLSLFLFLLATFVKVLDAHVCILQKQRDPSTATLLWSLPRKQRCLCQGVVAPEIKHSKLCQRGGTEIDEDLWFIDDHIARSLTNRQNWTPEKLDELLDRRECCMFRFDRILFW